MNKMILSAVLVFLFSATAMAQPARKQNNTPTTPTNSRTNKPVKQPGNNGWFYDSTFPVKNPVNGTTTTTNSSKITPTPNRTSQPVKQPRSQGWIDDSLLDIKNNRKVNTGITSQPVPNSNRNTNNTKLDDLRNPFDTTKKVQPGKTIRQ
jgi:hypothetical protein